MDYLQISLIILILLITVFLTLTGIQVFLILRDLKKSLNKLNKVLENGEEDARNSTRPQFSANLSATLDKGVKNIKRKESRVKPKRFYKRTL